MKSCHAKNMEFCQFMYLQCFACFEKMTGKSLQLKAYGNWRNDFIWKIEL